MSQTFAIILFFVSALILVKASSVVIARLSRIAYFLRVSEFLVSFVFVSIATSLPDVSVALSAAIQGKPELAFSNVIGANFLKLTLVMGLAAIFAKGLTMKSKTVRVDAAYASFAAFLPVLLLLDSAISRVDAAILLLFFGWYFGTLIFQRERFTKIFSASQNHVFDFSQFLRDLGVLFAGLIALVASSIFIINSAIAIAEFFHVSLPIIGMLLVALSITLPEIIFGARAIIMKHEDMVIGNLIGSVSMNSGLALGLSNLIAPLSVYNLDPPLLGILFTILVAVGFFAFSSTGKKISVLEGIALVSIYATFVVLVISA